MPSDANLVLVAQTTATAAAAATALDLKTAPAWLRRANAQLIITNISAATAGAVCTPGLQQSTDNTTFSSLGDFCVVTATTGAVAPGVFNLPCAPSMRYLRFNLANSVTTGTFAIAYQCRILPAIS